MQRCAFTPYEGNEPYIFISYAHKDSNRVYPILEELNRRGYRVWYDDGIAPGSEWPENIAQHLSACSLTLAFISPSSIASDNCRREVTFALSKRKPFLGIILEPTEMSLGMEMQLSAQQCIMKYSYATDESFFTKVCSCPDLQPCLSKVEAKEETVVPVQPIHTPAPAPKPQQIQPKESAKPLDKKMIGIIAVAAAAVLLVVILLFSLGGKDDQDNTLGGDTRGESNLGTSGQTEGSEPEDSKPNKPEGKTDEIYLSYANQVITADDIAYISQQNQLDKLEVTNCVFQAMEGLQLASTVTEVIITDSTGVTDLHCLSSLENLVTLDLRGSDVSDAAFTALTSKKLFEVDLTGNADFTDLSVFINCTGIRHIRFSETAVSSVNALANMKELMTVCGNQTQVKNISGLADLTKLTTLEFAFCGIEPINTPFYSLYLENVDLSFNQLMDLDFLNYCTTLKNVNVSYNELNDLDPLAKSVATLEILNVSGNDSVYEWELEFLPNCTNLKSLNVDGLFLNDLELVRGVTWLDQLSAVGCNLSDISALEGLIHLSYLNLACNSLKDISVLNCLVSPYLTLDLSFNSITDVSALRVDINYHLLNLTGNPLDPYTVPLVGGTDLVIGYDEGFEDPSCMDESNRTIFTYVRIVDCPMDKIVAMENRFGKDRVTFYQEVADYLTFLEENGVDCTILWLSIQGE